jgi:ppGpp synthetase/RelA/SpoT-type nucleotidyltranferase
MKIDRHVRSAFEEQRTLNEALAVEVRRIFKAIYERWHFESRLKEEESFAQKIEAGFYTGRMVLDDFLGTTLVVQNPSQVHSALEFVSDNFKVVYTRPKSPVATKLGPSDFAFNGIRMYVRLKPDKYGQKRSFDGIVFEVQIKTFLEHAWSVATHDITYKTKAVDWARSRIAFELKALLEHADLTIDEIHNLSKSRLLLREYEPFIRLGTLIKILERHWEAAQLPSDMIRLGQNVDKVLGLAQVSPEKLDEALLVEGKSGRGAKLVNLSPYGAVLQTLVNCFSTEIKSANAVEKQQKAILLSDVEVPPDLTPAVQGLFRAL